MDDPGASDTDADDGDGDGLSPDRAFWLLSDGTRLSILRALWAGDEDVVPFSELRARVGTADSGRFNYHLNKLVGSFVARVDGGYELTQAGREVVRAVLAGAINEAPTLSPVDIDGRCTECGGSLSFSYDEHGRVACTDCETTVMWNEFPPAGLTWRDPAAVAEAFERWTRSRFLLAFDGVCPNCAAPLSVTVVGESEASEPGPTVSTEHQCRNCKYEARAPLYAHVIGHPAVVSFFYDRGVDITDRPYWELKRLAREFTEEVVSSDPWRGRVVVAYGGDRLRLDLDATLDVVTVE